LIIKTLVRCQYPNVTDVFLNYVAKKTKGAKGIDYDLSFVIRSAKYLPVGDLPRLDDFATKLDEKFVDYFLEALQPLREAAQATQPK
jgi:hypothetical protein